MTKRWTHHTSVEGPKPARRYMAGLTGITQPEGDALIVFGGETFPGDTTHSTMNDVWLYDLNAKQWHELRSSDCLQIGEDAYNEESAASSKNELFLIADDENYEDDDSDEFTSDDDDGSDDDYAYNEELSLVVSGGTGMNDQPLVGNPFTKGGILLLAIPLAWFVFAVRKLSNIFVPPVGRHGLSALLLEIKR